MAYCHLGNGKQSGWGRDYRDDTQERDWNALLDLAPRSLNIISRPCTVKRSAGSLHLNNFELLRRKPAKQRNWYHQIVGRAPHLMPMGLAPSRRTGVVEQTAGRDKGKHPRARCGNLPRRFRNLRRASTQIDIKVYPIELILTSPPTRTATRSASLLSSLGEMGDQLLYPPTPLSRDLPHPPGDFAEILGPFAAALLYEAGEKVITILKNYLSLVPGDTINGNYRRLAEAIQWMADLQRLVLLCRYFQKPLTIPTPVQRLIYAARHDIEGLSARIGSEQAQDLRTICYTLVSPANIAAWTHETLGETADVEVCVEERLYRQKVRVQDLHASFLRAQKAIDGGLGVGGGTLLDRIRMILNKLGRPIYSGTVIIRGDTPIEQTAKRGGRMRGMSGGHRGWRDRRNMRGR
ncbi:hypothetical protein DFP72DRAFT_851822 [Ephemerocybe angulata]|uniref:Uncharacterized protein n=1 Tax=Ephemerocybe angulata TaxID=980116 RepID=A0A8H6HP61_9AGAR|nr:hypothetical protein DFP72DRAFT_851822 [Tulosesus angulatus]